MDKAVDNEETANEQQDNSPINEPWTVASVPRRFALALIRFYQRAISPLTPPTCRFHPTCSHYTYDAIARFGLARGAVLGLVRLCKCQPFHRGGYDPVPETFAVWKKTPPKPDAEDV